MKLNLGCGGHKLEGYVNVDSNPEENPDVVADLGCDCWPFEENSVDEANASHILEHLYTEELFHFMQELYRVCKPGAQIQVAVPHPRHDLFLNDPTHKRPVTVGTLAMFCKEHVETLKREKGLHLTPFYKYLDIDFYLHPKVMYGLDPAQDPKDPELEWKMKHLNNVCMEIRVVLEAVK